MSQAVKELAERYYPSLWNKARVRALVTAEKLTPEEYEGVVGEPFEIQEEVLPDGV